MSTCAHNNKREITRLSGPPLLICNVCGEHLSNLDGPSSVLGGKTNKEQQ